MGALGDAGVVGDQNDGVAFSVQGIEEVQDLPAGAGVQVARRLVGQQDRRPVDESPPDGDPLALAPGQFAGAVAGPVFQFDLSQNLTGSGTAP